MVPKPFEYALKEYGKRSFVGPETNPEISKYFQASGHFSVKDDETAWCAAFVNWCLAMANLVPTKSLMARSFLTYGTACADPSIGDLVVLWRIDPNGPYGHVGFYVGETKDTIFVLGGNQSERVDISEYPKSRVLGYRWY